MKTLITRLSSALKNLAPLIVFSLLVSNFIVSCCVIRSSRPQYYYKTLTVTNEVLTVVSNVVTASAALSRTDSSEKNSSFSTSSSRSDSPRSQRVNYKYSVVADKPCVFMYGRYYYEGDITSRGIILRIFPDRIYLHDGFYLENGEGRISEPLKERRLQND